MVVVATEAAVTEVAAAASVAALRVARTGGEELVVEMEVVLEVLQLNILHQHPLLEQQIQVVEVVDMDIMELQVLLVEQEYVLYHTFILNN